MAELPTSRPPVVELRAVSVRFGAATALHDVTARIDDAPGRGEFVALVGPSGCGKSTVLNLITGFLQPSAGEVLVHGRPVEGPGRDRGMIFQQYSSFPHLTVLDNVRFGLELNRGEMGLSAAERRDRALAMIEQVGLKDHVRKYPHQLSGGQQQRVAIARSFVMEPSMLLMDEPFSALDEPTRLDMQQLLVAMWHRTHPTILCVTHSLSEAVYLAERVWIFSSAPGQLAYDIRDGIPPSVDVPPLEAQERPEFKRAVQAVTQAFREACDPRADARTRAQP